MTSACYPIFCPEAIKLKLIHQGKVREIYDYSNQEYLIIASDRISAFDVVLDSQIEAKGVILTDLAYFWLEKFQDLICTHIDSYPREILGKKLKNLHLPDEVLKRTMLVKKIKPLNIEAIVRGYLLGSGFKHYEQSGSICGVSLPKNLKKYQKLQSPIFTPTTKAVVGDHDQNISLEQMQGLIGANLTEQIKIISLEIYKQAYQYCLKRGIIIADTKFEFGLDEQDKLVLIDEVLTPDSSRFLSLSAYKQGKIESFDKQIIRDYLLNEQKIHGIMPKKLSQAIIAKTKKQYQKIYKIITE